MPIELKKTVKQKQAEHELAKLAPKAKRAMCTLKDKEKIIYAPFSNLGALNFEKSTGYITIPDKQVIYTRVGQDEEEAQPTAKVQGVKAADDLGQGQGGQTNMPAANEGQKMVWHLQDLEEQIDAEKIEAPQLLPGIDIKEAIEEKKKSRRLYNPQNIEELDEIDPREKFESH